jgi:hypothetical protein
MKIASEQVIQELQKVIDAIPKFKNNPNDIAIIAPIDGKVTSIKHKDLNNYVIRNGELKLK